jgi:hypothetical protein
MTLFRHEDETSDVRPLTKFGYRRTLFEMGYRLRHLVHA